MNPWSQQPAVVPRSMFAVRSLRPTLCAKALAVLLSLFVLMPQSAHAFCPSCGAPAAVAVQYTSVSAALAAMGTALASVVGIGNGADGVLASFATAAKYDAVKGQTDAELFHKMKAMETEVRAANTVNMKSGNCRLQTMHNAATMVETKFEKNVAANLGDGVMNLFFNPVFTRERSLGASLQRLCRNGQLAKTDVGQKFWDAMAAATPAGGSGCFTDMTDSNSDGFPDFLRAFATKDVILNNQVLVPPKPQDMDDLNNPDGVGTHNPQTVWSGLSYKQKAYVSAVRYCENLALMVLKPLSVRNDAAMDPANAPVILQNFAAMGKLDTLMYACRAEIARRTAPDPALVGSVMPGLAESAKKSGAFLEKSGVKTSVFREGGKDYVSPALLSYGRNEAFCNSKATTTSFFADTGSDSEKSNNVVECENLKMVYQETEGIYRETFTAMVNGLRDVGQEFVAGKESPHAERGGLLKSVNFKTSPASVAAKNFGALLREK